MDDIIYFEVNNWFLDRDYPNTETFREWMGNDRKLYFSDERWVEENKLCVVRTIIDMSVNFCVTAKRQWVEKNCPELLGDYKRFLRKPDEYGDVHGKYGTQFLEYCDRNIGITYVDEQ